MKFASKDGYPNILTVTLLEVKKSDDAPPYNFFINYCRSRTTFQAYHKKNQQLKKKVIEIERQSRSSAKNLNLKKHVKNNYEKKNTQGQLLQNLVQFIERTDGRKEI